MTVDAVKPAITRTAIGDAALKAALRGIVHQAAVSGRDCAAVAALAADGLAQFTGDAAWAVVAFIGRFCISLIALQNVSAERLQ